MQFLKEHLSGFYEWKQEGEISIYDGNASRRIFNRWNGYQVLFVINVFLVDSGNASLAKGKKAESLIIDRLPLDTRSEISVLNWLQAEILKDSQVV